MIPRFFVSGVKTDSYCFINSPSGAVVQWVSLLFKNGGLSRCREAIAGSNPCKEMASSPTPLFVIALTKWNESFAFVYALSSIWQYMTHRVEVTASELYCYWESNSNIVTEADFLFSQKMSDV
ncbi:hypothetical protein BSQ33_07700 [Vibrio gazogenes]|uniref:Uncharacterized protein n=1 Tax=Vibrio gazogenes TaxID=687 RepID=A0A1Z2SEM9_VIBGA|nr:hypothetical protein BSQ33_07700 [Vibrio gazogenes]